MVQVVNNTSAVVELVKYIYFFNNDIDILYHDIFFYIIIYIFLGGTGGRRGSCKRRFLDVTLHDTKVVYGIPFAEGISFSLPTDVFIFQCPGNCEHSLPIYMVSLRFSRATRYTTARK